MTNSFVSLLFKKKQQHILLIKISAICVSIFVFLYLILHILNVFILNAFVNNIIEKIEAKPDTSVEYEVNLNFIKSNLTVEDVRIYMKSSDIKIEKIKIKKNSGILIPKTIAIKAEGIKIKTNAGFEYDIEQHGAEDGYILTLNRHFFSKPTFGGMKISSPVKYNISDTVSKIFEFNIDIFDYIHNGDKGITEYKGNMIIHRDILDLSLIQIDRPFKWDLKFMEIKTKGPTGLKGTDITDINNVKIEKCIFDFNYAQINAKGTLSYSQQLRDINVDLLLENHQKFLDAIFNKLLKDNHNNLQIKNLYLALKNTILPLLQKKNKDVKKKDLLLKLYKTESMPEMIINDYGVSEIAKKISAIIK